MSAITTTEDAITTTIGKRKVEIPLSLDLDELFELIDAVTELDALDRDADPVEFMRAMRNVIPDSFREAVKGVPAAQAMELFQHYIAAIGESVGKALA